MNKPEFKIAEEGKRPSAREHNKITRLLAAVANSLHIQGYVDSTGFHTRRTPTKRDPPGFKTYAVITATLQRADPILVLEDITKYEITILNGDHKNEEVDAWVFGYDENLLEGDVWFQIDEIKEVIEYDHPDFPTRKWWIMATVDRIQTGSGENIKCSEYWFQGSEKRRGSVYR